MGIKNYDHHILLLFKFHQYNNIFTMFHEKPKDSFNDVCDWIMIMCVTVCISTDFKSKNTDFNLVLCTFKVQICLFLHRTYNTNNTNINIIMK